MDILQVSLHQILRAKKLYPTGIFTEAQKFNTLVYVSISNINQWKSLWYLFIFCG